MAKCFACDGPIPEGAGQCPACHLSVAACRNPACGEYYPAEASFCPFCGEATRGDATAPAEAAAPTIAAEPSPPAAGETGTPALREPSTLGGSGEAPGGPAATSSYDQMLALFQGDGGAAPDSSAAVANQGATAPAPGGLGLPVGQWPGGSQVPSGVPAAFQAPNLPTMGPLGVGVPAMGRPGQMMPAMDLGGLAAPAATAGGAPATLEVETSAKFRRNQQGLLRIRVRGDGLSSEAQVDLTVQSDLLPAPANLQAEVGPLETHEFNAVRFVPNVAGVEDVRLSLTVKTPANVPLGRWHAAWQIEIEDVEKQEIHAGGDVFIVGGMPAGKMPGLEAAFALSAGGWQPLPLAADRVFNRRLNNTCPETNQSAWPQIELSSAWPSGARAEAAAFLRDQQTGLAQAMAIVCGNSASVGRGGDASVAWWLQPSPYDTRQHNRLSRRHFALELRDDRAWVTDWSTNGTWLNSERIARSQPHLLAHDDRVDPAQVVPFQVKLLAAQGRVHAVSLRRCDPLGDQLGYVLTDGQVPIPLWMPNHSAPAVWLAWRRTPAHGAEALVSLGDGVWTPLAADQQHLLADRYCFWWQSLSAPIEQTVYLESLQIRV